VKSAVETLEPTKVKLTIELDGDDLAPAIKDAYRQIAQEISIPGFRKGKAPARLIDQRVGRGAVIEQALNEALGGFYAAALQENDLRPMARPEIDMVTPPDPAEENPSMVFTAEVEVKPKFDLPDLAEVTVEVDPVEVTDAAVEEQLTLLRERFATLVGVDRPAQDGDFVVMDMTAVIGDEEIDSVSGVSYQIGSQTMLDGLDEALTGLSAGETTTFNSPLAGGPRQGEEALVTVTVQQVKERDLPEANDEFAEMASSFDTIGELRDDLREQVAQMAERAQLVQAQERLISTLLDTVDIPVPDGVVTADALKHLEARGIPAADEALAEAKTEAAREVRTQLLADALAVKLEIRPTEVDFANFVVTMAQRYGVEPEQFVAALRSSGEGAEFYQELARNQAMVEALRNVKVVDSDGKSVDVASKLPAPARAGSETADQEQGEPAAADSEDYAVDEIEVDLSDFDELEQG
jgi:trigger factor